MTGQSNNRLLIIDDNAAIHEDFRKILQPEEEEVDAFETEAFGRQRPHSGRLNFQVDSAFQGREGVDKIRGAVADQRPYPLAFIDIRMPPGWDGIETTARIWEVDPDVQIVICTAYSDYSWEEMVQSSGTPIGLSF